MNIFHNHEPDDNRRPDILIRNPYGGGKQIIIDVAVTGIDGTTQRNDDKPNQPLVAQENRKLESTDQQLNLTVLPSSQVFFLMLAKLMWLSKTFSFNKLNINYN